MIYGPGEKHFPVLLHPPDPLRDHPGGFDRPFPLTRFGVLFFPARNVDPPSPGKRTATLRGMEIDAGVSEIRLKQRPNPVLRSFMTLYAKYPKNLKKQYVAISIAEIIQMSIAAAGFF